MTKLSELSLAEMHEQNVKKFVGRKTDKGVIEKVCYLTFDGNSGGNYSDLPIQGGKGLLCADFGKKAYVIGNLKFID